jgi:arsenate reductase
MIKIYHNTRCGKSRCALQALEQAALPVQVIEYLKTPLDVAEITLILQRLKKRPLDIIRKKEPLFKAEFEGKTFTDAQWIQILADHPVLMERPIILTETEAWIARDDATVDAMIQEVSTR